MSMEMLEELVTLCREFGTPDYVKGGGGNGSVKDADTLWIKPSGTTMEGLTADSIVAMDRDRIAVVYEEEPPPGVNQREAWVKDSMLAAVREDSSGRPSVEAPLHNSFEARYVIHTHPPIVNAMVCTAKGEEVCQRLFPDALWMDYVNPGFCLSIAVREAVAGYAAQHGRQPTIVMIENHGIFVSGDTPDEIRATYARVMKALSGEYAAADVQATLPVGPAPSQEATDRAMRVMVEAADGTESGPAVAAVRACGPFAVPRGPLTPDHIVYMKSYALIVQDLTPDAIRSFIHVHGYYPYVVSTTEGVYTFGESDKVADLARDLAQDGALIVQLADAFGGVQFMTDVAREFIENWEVESYRKQQI